MNENMLYKTVGDSKTYIHMYDYGLKQIDFELKLL